MTVHRADIGVIGGGPAGSTVATRLAQLGHRVVLVDRGRPRHHRAEILAPGTIGLLALTGADGPVRAAGFPVASGSIVDWDEGPRHRPAPAGGALVVDRASFDSILLDEAERAGVELIRPARAGPRGRTAGAWSLAVDSPHGDHTVRCDFLVDATGRPARRGRLRAAGAATLAVTGRWIGGDRDAMPSVVAVADGWIWAIPAPAGLGGADADIEITAFVDPVRWRGLPGVSTAARYRSLVAASLEPGGAASRLVGRVRVADATPSALREPASPRWLAVGDAAVALDPLSSTGVQKAIQSALAAAIVVNTVLRRPAHAALALGHHRTTLVDAAARHATWAAESYAAVIPRHPTAFWLDRAAPVGDHAASPLGRRARPERPGPRTLVRLSPLLEVVDVARVGGEFVTPGFGVRHPGLDGEVAYVDGVELAPLLAAVPSAAPLEEIASRWSSQVSADAAWRIAGWLYRHGVLEGTDAA